MRTNETDSVVNTIDFLKEYVEDVNQVGWVVLILSLNCVEDSIIWAHNIMYLNIIVDHMENAVMTRGQQTQ